MEYFKTIYKFREYKNYLHKKILLENELYLASPDSFNDPFDCRIPFDLDSLNSNEKRLKYAERIFKRRNEKSDNDHLKRKEIINNFSESIKLNKQNFQTLLDQITFETSNNILGILSFSLIWDNILLWSHYGENHRGFCIGFNREKLENSKMFYCGGSIIYSEKFPLLDPLDTEKKESIENQVFIKSKDWEYEQEYRLVKDLGSYKENRTENERKIFIPNDFFSEIILGCNFPQNEENEIFQIAEIKKIPVYKAIKQKNSFILKKIKLYPET